LCGISGILSDDPEIKRSISYINALLKHRGPDDEGFLLINTHTGLSQSFSGEDSVDKIKNAYPNISSAEFDNYNLALGHRRLTIIDLSEQGHCPMSDEDGKIWITYNGEIYNYIELREELKSYGFKFRTQSDTEVIIKSYLKWGEECFSHFNGMWAFAIWDSLKKKLILSRDRFGIKPLYFVKLKNFFAFSSEMKPLLHLAPENFEINDKKIPFFLLYGNRLNDEETYISNIQSLKPSHYLIFENGSVKIKLYYEIPVTNDSKPENALKEELLSLFTDSVKLRFRSDVPVGTCLSGGFDSSSIVAISHEIFSKGLNTFSAVWSYKECDESNYIDIVNRKFNCVPNKVEPSVDEFESIFTKIIYYQEIPTEGPGLHPQWYVMKKAKGNVKVLLDGQGGDEVFGGYLLRGAFLKSLIIDRKYKELFTYRNMYYSFLAENGFHDFSSTLFPNMYNKIFRGFLSNRYKILNKETLSKMSKNELYYDIAPPVRFKSYLNNIDYHFITNLSIPALLHYEDRSSMAHSIESRVPFLDYRLVEFGINLPPQYLSDEKRTRPLFRSVFENLLPKQVVERKDKLGYPVPFAEWTRGRLKNWIFDTLTNPKAVSYKYLDLKQVEKHLTEHFNNKIDYGWNIWRLLSLEKFLELINSVKHRHPEYIKS
jgi:asparagine synthase (glutamine-hydrolysing)